MAPSETRIQTQGVHHITLVGANRQTSIDFWEGVLGMPFVFEQPNLDDAEQNHLYFDPGDGRLITIFTSESWQPDRTPNPTGVGNLHHIAFIVSRATYTQAAARLKARGFANSGEIDRGFMDSLYFRDPLGQLLELACYKFEPPVGITHAEVLAEAHRIRVAKGDKNIADAHLADAIEALAHRRKAPDPRGVT
ncbi:MAG: VOC family protein [Hyphomicrobiaceae bacterium]|nr:VOC family protein [Hyphomicrobiaceae bacterium]